VWWHLRELALEADRILLCAADLPTSILNCCLIFVEDSTDKTVRALPVVRIRLIRSICQVVASLLVSVLLLGFKLSALKRLFQVTQRRKELETALSLLQPKLEEEDLAAWLDDLDHDTEHRQGLLGQMALPSGRVYSMMENGAVESCQRMFTLFNDGSASATKLKRPAAIQRSETKHDEATRLLFGFAEAEIRADPLDIVAYMLEYASSRRGQTQAAGDSSVVRYECLERVNPHHVVIFARYKARGVSDRTFLMSAVVKQVAEDPPTFLVAVVPIPSHDKITRKDEAGAVRGEICRSFRLTKRAPGVTKLEYCCSLDMKGHVPQIITDTIAVPKQQGVVYDLQCYFQHVRPLSECDADDGRVVGHMLLDLAQSKPEDPAHTIRAFVNRTAMLRECGFRHICAMLAQLLDVDAAQGEPDNCARIVELGPSVVTEEQAHAIGRAIASSIRRSHVPATALKRVLQSHEVLRAMKAGFVWFVPMLEVITEHNAAELRRSSWMKRLHSIAPAKGPSVVVSDETLHADGASEDRAFSSVVRLGAPCVALHVIACIHGTSVRNAMLGAACCATGARRCTRWQGLRCGPRGDQRIRPLADSSGRTARLVSCSRSFGGAASYA
jgi:hypothetical protein